MDLVDRGIYTPIAIGLKGGAWREASMMVLAEALSAGGVKEIATESKSSLAHLKQIQMNTASTRRRVKLASSSKEKRSSKLVTVSAATASAATASTAAASTSAASTSAEQPSDSAVDCPSSSV